MAASEGNIQINPPKSRKFLRETSESVKVKPLALRFALALVTNLKLMIS